MLDLEKHKMILSGIEDVIKEMENRYSISEMEDAWNKAINWLVSLG